MRTTPGVPVIGERVHFMSDDGHCVPAVVIEVGGNHVVRIRSVETGQVVMETRTWSNSVVRLNASGTTYEESPFYWDYQDTWLPRSWHWTINCEEE